MRLSGSGIKRLMLMLAATAALAAPRDSLPFPKHKESFVSINRLYRFECEAVDKWATPKSKGTLYQQEGGIEIEIWSRELPNRFRPRLVLVSGTGYVVTFDDWDFTPTPNSIVVYTPRGGILKKFSFDDIAAITRAGEQDLTAHAGKGLGWWMSQVPVFARGDDDENVLLSAGGKRLVLKVARGVLALTPSRAVAARAR